MKHIDARTLSPAEQKEKRRTALRMRQQGYRFKDIVAALDVHQRTVQEWWSRYQVDGEAPAIAGGQGILRWISSALYRPLIVSASALS